MRRISCAPRHAWSDKLACDGITWHTENGVVAWNDCATYAFTEEEIERIRRTAAEVHQLCMQAAAHVVRHNLWARLGIRNEDVPLIRDSWERQDWSLCGRFDFLLDKNGEPRLIEYNAETALSLVESACAQRRWQTSQMPNYGQFNQLRDALLTAWRAIPRTHVHCVWRPQHAEVAGTVEYMAKIIREAGHTTSLMALHRMGWDRCRKCFVDQDLREIQCCYKIYPWDWMLEERFSSYATNSSCRFVEPPWRLLLAGKGLLSILHERFPDYPAILPCAATPERLTGTYVQKPLFGREGDSISIIRDGQILGSTPGEYGRRGFIYQSYVEAARYDGNLAQLGIWMVGEQPVALSIRESRTSIITGDTPLVSHVVIREL